MQSVIVELGLLAVQNWIKALLNRHATYFQLIFGTNNPFAVCQFFISKEARTAVIHFQDHLVADEALVGEEEQQGIAVAGKVVDGDIVT